MDNILQYKGYFATVHLSREEEIFFGQISGINDLVSFEGSTVSELKDSFRKSVDNYLDTCKALAKEPLKAK